MKVLGLLLALCVSVNCYCNMAICAIFQDDAAYIPEWVQFHLKEGVDHFYLYNNLSPDPWQDLLKEWIDVGLVEVIDWPYASTNAGDWNDIQCKAYMDCIKRVKGKYRWCAFLDTDEFLFTLDGTSLPTYMKRYRKYPGVQVHWVMYGTSGVPFIPSGERMVDHLVFRSEIDYPENINTKSIVRPSQVVGCGCPHFFYYKNNALAVDELKNTKKPGEMGPITVTRLRINHYWSRDEQFFYNKKIPRRVKWYGDTQGPLISEKNMNAVYDPILKFR